MGLTEEWDPSFGDFLKTIYQNYPRNLDHNSGNPIGVAVCQLSAQKGRRITAAGAYLSTTPPNLTIMTDVTVIKIVFQNQQATGVEVSGKQSKYSPVFWNLSFGL